MIRKRLFLLWITILSAVCTVNGQKLREIHILAANDMHATIEAFPQLGAIADSLRELYPSLLVFSAGDNRTGNPKNDMFRISSYPMTMLMNLVGFDATALGNHEFDVNSLPPLMKYSAFSYICANIFPSEESGIHTVPTKVFDVDGLKVGVIGVVQVNAQGRPDTHPDNVKGLRFALPKNVVAQYEGFSRQCDATILLSHLGYQDDIEMAETYPWLDLIIGGHSHTQLTEDEPLHNGVLITQNKNKLPKVTHITLTVKNGKVVDKKAEYIDVKAFSARNRMLEVMVEYFSNNPMFKRVVGYTETPFKTKDELNYLMCEAFLHEGEADISIVNNGGVRLDSLAVGDITMQDVLSMDPFYNEAVEMHLTGEEILKILTTYSRGSLYHLPRVAGAICEATIDNNDPNKDRLKNIRLKTLDGEEFDIHKTYKVVTNSYMQSACKSLVADPGHSLNIQTSVMLTNYLEKLGVIKKKSTQYMKVTEE
jgi:2',3'-cyclic-nucleotide 2'-phosphodiesterase (5'-nucleotidase family)